MNNKGSGTIMLIMFLSAMMILITAFIMVSKERAVRGECEALSFMWGKAIISEYDVNLYKDYGILAFYGHERNVDDKLTKYCKKTFDGQNSCDFNGVTVELSKYKLSSLNNFGDSINFLEIKDINERKEREVSESDTVIRNSYVKDTLISEYTDEDFSITKLKKMIGRGYDYDDITGSCEELMYICNRFNNHLYIRNEGKTVLKNEWEYIVCGEMDDQENFIKTKRRIWLLRNVLNLGYLYSDTDKRQISLSMAQVITPGPWAFAVQAAILEAWSVLESNHDIGELIEGGEIPLIKTDDSWYTDIDAVLSSDELTDKLTEEELSLMEENEDELKNLSGGETLTPDDYTGLDYEEYVLMFIALLNGEKRLSRMMDLIQMNMKLRYYRDFNMFEYNVGAEYVIKVNGRNYEGYINY